MFPYACVTLIVLLAAGARQSCGTEVRVENADKQLCLYADLMLNFTVTYEVAGSTNATVTFPLPSTVSIEGSNCSEDSSLLKISFGKGHSWALNFTRDNHTYRADSVVFTYNLRDDSIFKNSSLNETKTVSIKSGIDAVDLNTTYTCKSLETLDSTSVKQVLWNVSLQAFISNGNLSENATICKADRPTTTPATHTTTATPKPTSTPKPTPLPQPTTGTYRLNTSSNGTTCLMAELGLQMNYKEGKENFSENVDPTKMKVGGKCSSNSSDAVLQLMDEQMTISFTFVENKQKFSLHAVNVSIVKGNETFSWGNPNMSLWEAFVGSSYMCKKQQTVTISDSLTLLTYDLRVQPFDVKNGTFATADDCKADMDTSLIVPIAVGVALAALVLIVLIAYIIGRRRNQAHGYESF